MWVRVGTMATANQQTEPLGLFSGKPTPRLYDAVSRRCAFGTTAGEPSRPTSIGFAVSACVIANK